MIGFGGLEVGKAVSKSVGPLVTSAEHNLNLAKEAYQTKPTSPELLSDFQQAFWIVEGLSLGVSKANLVVPECPYSEDGLRKLLGFHRPNLLLIASRGPNDFAFYLPQIVSTTPEGLRIFCRGNPVMESVLSGVMNTNETGKEVNLHGWMRTERDMDAPLLGLTSHKAEVIISDRQRQGATLNSYGVAAQQMWLLTGQYLDGGYTWSRLLSSRFQGFPVAARFTEDGQLKLSSVKIGPGPRQLAPLESRANLGVRSVMLAPVSA